MTQAEDTRIPPCREAFTASTRELLATMAQLDAECVKVCRFRNAGVSREVAARMEVQGATRGTVVAATDMKLAGRIVGRMTGKTDSELTPAEIAGGFKEILNIIAGSAKSRLAGQPGHFELTCPEPWDGDGAAVEKRTGADLTAVVFEVDGVRFASGFSFAAS